MFQEKVSMHIDHHFPVALRVFLARSLRPGAQILLDFLLSQKPALPYELGGEPNCQDDSSGQVRRVGMIVPRLLANEKSW